MAVTLKQIEAFVWIADLGSFRAAAEKLHLTQPAISARINVLEQDLGTAVFVRETRNAELTPEGRKLFIYAERLMKLEQDVLTAFADTANVAQTIRVGASETIISTWLPEFMTHLGKARTQLSFDLIVDSTDNLRNALVAREIDLAFLMGPVAETTISNREICTYDQILAASPELNGRHDFWSLADIGEETILTFASNTKPYRHIRELLTSTAVDAPHITTSTSLGAIIRLALSGMGICAIPSTVIKSELASGALVQLDTDVELPNISFTASFVSGSTISSLMNDITDQVQAFLANRLIKNIYQN